ncbi:MAG: 8-amino-7-oxononanoate synthase [Prevotella sp.]|nr:8-amino-7-oxononanoate synthase [Prevotella sp.]MCM1075691.1 8-amino-7-oxononanoate synthase [Ruminococcus sp.]
MSSYSEILTGYKNEGRLRAIPAGCAGIVLDFSSNDYMGITSNPRLIEEFLSQSNSYKFSSSASRLLSSEQAEYKAFEDWLGAEYRKSVLLFNSGYHANAGCVSALAVPGTVILSDKLIHASIIDGIRLSKAPYKRFRHNDIDSLSRELVKVHDEAERVLVIVESIYSMDGDIAPLNEIVALKERFPKILLYVDEAHALGVRGERGLGVCEELGILDEVDVLIGTFGKAVGSMGAFAATSEELNIFLLNNARSFIFSTALPPINVAFSHFAMRKLLNMNSERKYLAELGATFRAGVEAITGESTVSASQIVPLMAYSNERALWLSAMLKERGILALPIRKPTVPVGTERLRFSLSAAMTEGDIKLTLNTLADIYEA